jgi:autotransporter-like protein
MNFRKFLIVSILLFGYLPTVFANYTNISGTYSGTINFDDVEPPGGGITCPSPGNFSGTLTITLIGDDQGNITGGSGQFNSGSPDPVSNISGTNDNTNFGFTFTASGDPGTLGGTFTANTLTINSGNVNSPTDCDSINISGTLTKSGSTVASKNTPSSSVTDAILFNTQLQGFMSGLSSHIGAALSGFFSFSPTFGDNHFGIGGMTGLNAGDGTQIPYGVWGNYSYTSYENDLSTTAFEGVSHSFLGGIDFGLWETAILGVAVGFDNSDIDTTFNGGNQNTNSFTIAPYFGGLLNDTLSVDFNIGYTNVQYDQFRTATNTIINSAPRADRWFGAFNLNAIKFVDKWALGARVGTLYATSVIDGYTESNGTVVSEARSKVGSASIAGDVAYSYKEFEPFLSLSYQYDFSLQNISAATDPQPANDKDDILLSVGVRYFEKSGITGNLEYSKRFLREDFNEDRISLTIRADF